MQFNDLVYGRAEINEPVLVELINSKPLQRIKKVNQAGTQLVEPHRTSTRYDHCVGVLILLRKYDASIEEQIGGLLHDVPHTAFSHAVDFVFKEGESQVYHERFLQKIVFESEIPAILKKYNIDPEFVTNDEHFSLLEQPIPNLCADRIDYILRDMVGDKTYSPKNVDQILTNLVVVNKIFAIKNQLVALKFARDFMNQASNSYNAPKTLATFELMGELIRDCFSKGILVENDLFTTDETVMEKIKKSDDQNIQRLLKLLNPKLDVKFNEEDYDYETRGKVRYIDPLVKVGETTKPLTSLIPTFSNEINEFIAKTKKGYRVKLSQT